MRQAGISAAALVVLLVSGCDMGAYFLRPARTPLEALEARMDTERRRDCLIVFMPGMLDGPDDYLEHGFVEDAQRASRRCDMVAVDAHFAYYRAGTLRERVQSDILTVAESRGYREFWIVGISMGGLGTLLVSQTSSSPIRGVVLLAPFLGDEALVEEIVDSGGLAAWDAPEDADPLDEDDFDDAMWAWLQGYVTDPDAMPELYIGVGTEDRLRPGIDLLAAVLPRERHGTVPGGHRWDTWRVLWRRLLQSPPWDPGPATPSMAEGAR